MSKVVSYIDPADGLVKVASPSPSLIAELGEDAAIDAIKLDPDLVKPGATEESTHERSELPNKKFRIAWTKSGGVVTEDMVQSRLIHMDRIRQARESELVRLDKDEILARGDQPTLDTIWAEKDVLKNIPQRDTAVLNGKLTAGDLDAYWPAELPAR